MENCVFKTSITKTMFVNEMDFFKLIKGQKILLRNETLTKLQPGINVVNVSPCVITANRLTLTGSQHCSVEQPGHRIV